MLGQIRACFGEHWSSEGNLRCEHLPICLCLGQVLFYCSPLRPDSPELLESLLFPLPSSLQECWDYRHTLLCLTFKWLLQIGIQILGLVLQTLCPHCWCLLTSLAFPFFDRLFSHISSCVFSLALVPPSLPQLPYFLISPHFLLPISSSLLLLAVSSGWPHIHNTPASASQIAQIVACSTVPGHFLLSLTIHSLSLTRIGALTKILSFIFVYERLMAQLHLPCQNPATIPYDAIVSHHPLLWVEPQLEKHFSGQLYSEPLEPSGPSGSRIGINCLTSILSSASLTRSPTEGNIRIHTGEVFL